MINENSRLVYTNESGGLSIVHPAPLAHLKMIPEFREMTQEAYEAHVIERSIPQGVKFEILEAEALPQDRTFRNAWRKDKKNISIDLDAAKEIQKDKWREARKPLLEKLDLEYMRSLEAGDKAKQKEISEKKQALRDVTLTDLSAVNTPDELKAVWPKELEA
jgi:hypothetical protein